MENMTAKVSCFARAYHHKNNRKHIFDDTMAGGSQNSIYQSIINIIQQIRYRLRKELYM